VTPGFGVLEGIRAIRMQGGSHSEPVECSADCPIRTLKQDSDAMLPTTLEGRRERSDVS
jgi:hypothetical protein